MNYKPNVRSVFVLGILFLIFSLEAISQFSFYKNYTVNDGLPSSKIYHMIQDSKGYIWFATENGVSRFDGYEFKNFTANDGLPTNSTLKIYEDYKGRIWFSSFSGQISYYEKGNITEFLLNEKLENSNFSFFDFIHVDSSDNVFLSSYNGGFVFLNQNSKIISYYERPKMLSAMRNYFVYIQNKTSSVISSIVFPDDTCSIPEIMPFNNGMRVRFVNDTEYPWYQKYCLQMKNMDYIITLGPILKKLEIQK